MTKNTLYDLTYDHSVSITASDSIMHDTITITDSTSPSLYNYSSGQYSITAPHTGGYVYTNTSATSAGTTGINWADTITLGDIEPSALHVKGDANFEGDIKLKGNSLGDTLKSIEERLAILRPSPELEEKWDNLKELGRMYRELEAEIIEKQKIWDILKK